MRLSFKGTKARLDAVNQDGESEVISISRAPSLNERKSQRAEND